MWGQVCFCHVLHMHVPCPFQLSDITCGLICGISGVRTTVRSIDPHCPPGVLHAASRLHSALVDIAGGHFPAAVVFAHRIVSPSLFAATYEYHHVVCASQCGTGSQCERHLSCYSFYPQQDMEYMVDLCKGHPDMDLPTITAPSVLCYISPARGFGVFAATDIPKDTERTNKHDPRRTSACVGTYGGVVCAFDELQRPNYAYSMYYGILPTLFTRYSLEYVVIFLCLLLFSAIFHTLMLPSYARVTAGFSTAVAIQTVPSTQHTTWPLMHLLPVYYPIATILLDICGKSSRSSRRPGMADSVHTYTMHMLMYREIMAGEEMTLTYERDDKDVYPFNELVGGAYMLRDCNCGSVICCGAISSRLMSGVPGEFDMFFVGEITHDSGAVESETNRCVLCVGISMHTIHTLNAQYATKYHGDTSGGMLNDFLAQKFRHSSKPIGEETMAHRMLALKHLSNGMWTLHEQKQLERARQV